MWLSTVSAAALCDIVVYSELVAAAHVSLVAVFSAVVLCLAYSIVLVCRSLIGMVDAFCCDVVDTMPLEKLADVWNLTQAVHRKASVDVETSLLALCALLALSVPLLIVDMALIGARGSHLLPVLFMSCGIIYSLLAAAMVSEKCGRIPAFINAISFGDGTDRLRQHTVDYIASSAAGFYVLDTRLTMSMAVKMTYVWCMVVVGAFTQLSLTEQ